MCRIDQSVRMARRKKNKMKKILTKDNLSTTERSIDREGEGEREGDKMNLVGDCQYIRRTRKRASKKRDRFSRFNQDASVMPTTLLFSIATAQMSKAFCFVLFLVCLLKRLTILPFLFSSFSSSAFFFFVFVFVFCFLNRLDQPCSRLNFRRHNHSKDISLIRLLALLLHLSSSASFSMIIEFGLVCMCAFSFSSYSSLGQRMLYVLEQVTSSTEEKEANQKSFLTSRKHPIASNFVVICRNDMGRTICVCAWACCDDDDENEAWLIVVSCACRDRDNRLLVA